jgi:MFS family permease
MAPKVNPWAIAITVSMAAFIEVLDTSVANVALPYIAGGLGASYDDSTWVLTSYLAANAIVLPISGWLAEAIGRKRYFMISLAIFTVSSLLCGLAPNLPLLLLFRAVQGIAAADCNRWRKPFSTIRSLLRSAAQRLLSMASVQFSPLPSGRCWGVDY